jgi:hypothetical protein
MRAYLTLLVFALPVTALWSASAQAQGWLADRDRAEGSGIRLGDLELHPGIGAEGGYDSNVFLSEEAQGSAVMRVAPHLYLQTLGEERRDGAPAPVAFRAGLSGALQHWFSFAERTNVGVGQDAKLTLRPGQIFTLELAEEFKRDINPFTEPTTSAGIDTDGDGVVDSEGVPEDDTTSFARDTLSLGARAQLGSPGGVLKVGLGYRFGIDHFEADEFRDNRSNSHTVRADTSWEFFPKTALFWDGSVSRNNFIRSTDELSPAEMAARTLIRNDSTGLRTKIGLNGALTSRVGFTLAGGYGADFFDAGDDAETFIAQVEARWRPQETILWSVGYDRETMPSFQGNFVRMDRLKTKTQLMLGGVFVLSGRAEVTFLTFGDDPTFGERDDIHFMGGLSGEYRVIDWFAITAEGTYWQNFTDFEFDRGPGQPDDPAEFNRLEAWLGVRAFL